MIKEYLITYEKNESDERYVEITTYQIRIPGLTLFDAVDYAHNMLELDNIKEVYEVC